MSITDLRWFILFPFRMQNYSTVETFLHYQTLIEPGATLTMMETTSTEPKDNSTGNIGRKNETPITQMMFIVGPESSGLF